MRLVASAFAFLAALQAWCQKSDTTYLQEVSVFGVPVTTHSTGLRPRTLKSGEAVTTLADVLADESSVYVKGYGNGQLSSIAFRGTSASQTAVLWNGININMPTAGQTDFSLIPLYLIDQVTLQPGAGSALYGSDAIGGSVLLGQQPQKYQKGWAASVFQEVGSFGRYSAGAKAAFSGKRFGSRTRVFMSEIENDFPYPSPGTGIRKRQPHAWVEQHGISQQVAYRINDLQEITLDALYTYNYRAIQPPATSISADETLTDKNARFALSYLNDSRLGVIRATLGYLKGKEVYFDDVPSTIRLTQLAAILNIDKAIGKRSSVRYGFNSTQYRAEAQNFNDGLTDNRTDLYASFKHRITPGWLALITVRQAFYDGREAPFTPSLGTEYRVVNTDRYLVELRGQVARGYRVPTLNDRYWDPGANPDVEPEDALQAEAGVTVTIHNESSHAEFDVAWFHAKTDRLIVWVPVSSFVWSPTNLRAVYSRGLETSARWKHQNGPYTVSLSASYSYVLSTIEKGRNELDKTVGKQLTYVPVHQGNAHAEVSRNSFTLGVMVNASGVRYTSLDNLRSQALDPYGLVNASLAYEFKLLGADGGLSFRVNNLTDQYYELYDNHAMPGRNFSISLTLNLSRQSL